MGVIINGDDFGLGESCTRAIAEAMERGIINSTTMTANGEYFAEAVELARVCGFTDRIGVHFNLTEGRPLTREMSGCAAFASDGRFHKDYIKNPRPLSDRETEAVLCELTAQVKRLRDSGIPVVRADSHHYIHTFIYIAPLVAEVCRKQGIGRIRLNRTFDTPERPRITEGRADNGFWRAQGFETTERFGRLSDVDPCNIPDDTEIMLHPDYDRNGALIDRTGFSDGFPSGEVLCV